MNTTNTNDGWPEYKIAVLERIDHLTNQVEKLQNGLSCVDKSIGITQAKIVEKDKTTELSDRLLEKKLEAMNEFRGALKDQASTFMTRAEFNLLHERAMDDIRTLRESRATDTGKATQKSVNFVTIIAVSGIVISLLSIILGLYLQ